MLEIGGGVGHVQVELLRRGAARAVNLEIATSYEAEADQLLDAAGLGDRVERRVLDIARSPDEVERPTWWCSIAWCAATPTTSGCSTAAGSKAGRLLVFSHPPRNVATRAVLWVDNSVRRIKGDSFRRFAIRRRQMLAALGTPACAPPTGGAASAGAWSASNADARADTRQPIPGGRGRQGGEHARCS